MNTEHDLDRLIDAAASGMMQQEPSDALTRAVMEGVAEREPRFVSRQALWITVGSGIAAASLVVLLGPRNQHSAGPVAGQPHPSSARQAVITADGPAGGRGAPSGATREQLIAQSRLRRGIEPQAAAPAEATAQIDDPIVFETITPAPIEVERLEVATLTPIDPIEIAPIEIAPLSASND